MAKVTEWTDSAKKLSDGDLEDIKKAFWTLGKWEIFYREYSSELDQLKAIIRAEITDRARKKYIRKPTLEEYREATRDACCASCGASLLRKRKIDTYPHENGWWVHGFDVPQWLSIHCPKCGYDTSLTKLGIPRSIDPEQQIKYLGVGRTIIETQVGNSPVCPRCGHWNALLEEGPWDARVFKCRDCGYSIPVNKTTIVIMELDKPGMGSQSTYHEVKRIPGERY